MSYPEPFANASAYRKMKNLEAENARLKAEVERLRASSFVTAVPVEQYERLRKAGDAMAFIMAYEKDEEFDGFVEAWNAAKEGNQP